MHWRSEFTMGHARLDQHHRALFEALATLSPLYCDRDLVHSQIKILEHHVAAHFALEEELMAQSGYPQLPAHQALHEEFRATVRRLRDHWNDNDLPQVQTEIVTELSSWLSTHILGADREYLPWLGQDKGPSSVG